MRSLFHFRSAFVFGAVAAALLLASAVVPIAAQSKKARPKGISTKQLDVRLEQLQSSMLRETAELARDYEEAGQLEQAKNLLEVLLKLNPKLPGIKDKIEQLDEQLLSSNEFEIEIDTAKGWTAPVATVTKDRPVRLQAQGQYQIVMSGLVGPGGFPTDDPNRDLAAGVPFGALMGILIDQESGKPGKPFVIGAKKEWTPKESGRLLLRVNVPPDAKCNGRIKVTLSGFARGA